MEDTDTRDDIDRQIVADARYRQEYSEWIASLSSEERETVKEADPSLLQPLVAYTGAAAPAPLEITAPDVPWHSGQPIPDDDIDKDDVAKIGEQADAVAALLRVVIFPSGMRGFQPQAALARLVALAHCLHVPGIGDRSFESLAQELGCTRALLCSYAVRIRDWAGLDCYAGRSVTAREAQSARALWRFKTKDKK